MRLPHLLIALLLSLLPFPLPAQPAGQVPVRRLGAADAVFPEPFSQIRGIRELSDGRLLVSDWIEEQLVVLAPRAGTRRLLGRTGQGPREYRMPARLIALPADSSLLWDEGNQRLLLIGPDLAIVGPVPRPEGGEARNPSPVGADGSGWLYFATPGWVLGLAPGDSLPVSRWDRRTGRVEPIGRIKPALPRDQTPTARGTMGIPIMGFSPADAFLPVPDGRVVFVRSGDYSIEVRMPDGRLRKGATQAYLTRPVTEADKTWWVRRFMTTSPVGGRGPGGGMGRPAAEWQTAEFVRGVVANHTFADRMPYFAPGGVWLAPGGDLLVQRTSGTEAELLLDRFDLEGHRREQLVLPAGRQVAGVGTGTLYLVRSDEDGLQRLERYRLR